MPDASAVLFIAAASALLSGVAVDILRTVLDVPHGGGPVTGPLGRAVWLRLVAWHHRALPAGVLRVGGLLLTASVVGMWLAGLICGWSLIYHASGSALVSGTTGEPVGTVDRLYFAAASLFSHSLGDVVPGASGWRLVAAANAGSGLLVLSLSITYAVPVVEAASRRRVFASTVSTLGDSASSIVTNHLRAPGASPLLEELPVLRRSVIELAHLHLAYPVLHYFHSGDRSAAFGPSLAALYDALVTLEFACAEHAPDRALVGQARHTIEAFLDPFLLDRHARHMPQALPPTGCPQCVTARVSGAWDCHGELEEHRRKLAALVHEEGWTISDPTDHTDGRSPRPRSQPSGAGISSRR